MRIYRLAEGVNVDGLPFLFEGNAYLADGTPLTETDRFGRIVPALATLATTKSTCAGSLWGLAERGAGIEALARALNARDSVRAPLVLHLRIDPVDRFAKYNPFHKPPGPGGGQFTNSPEAGGSPAHDPSFQHVGQSLNVGVTSNWVNGIYGPEMDKAHEKALGLVRMAALIAGNVGFKPGMPGYGIILDRVLENEIEDLHASDFHVKPVYLNGTQVPEGSGYPPGSSVPDLVFGPVERPLMIFELKSGRAARNLNDSEIAEQKRKALLNVPGPPIYQYLQVYDQ
jgi:hypothetical protein